MYVAILSHRATAGTWQQ